jgi:hypothetical protein
MSDKVISVDNLSKRYLVGHQLTQLKRYTLRDAITWEARNFARKAADFLRGRQIVQGDEVEEFWALKDVSFEVRHGEVPARVPCSRSSVELPSQLTARSESRDALRACSKLAQASMRS